MPPKKKGSKGGKGSKGTGGIIDGVSTSEMSREQLEQFALRIQNELEREREERNFFQLERDKLRTFWEITRQQLDEHRAELRNKDRAMEEALDRHDDEIKIYKQQIKHLMYEHTSNLAELKAENMVTLKMAENDYSEQEVELLKDKKALKKQIIEEKFAHEEEMKALHMKHSEELNKLREEYAHKSEIFEKKMDRLLTELRNNLNLKHKMEITETEERKNTQISQLIAKHHQAFAELKSYYNDITVNNLALIASLKEQMATMKQEEEHMDKRVKQISAENRQLVKPLDEAKKQVADLQRQLTNYNKDKLTLSNMKKHVSSLSKQLQDLRAEYNVLEMQLEKVKLERNDLHDRFVAAIIELQQKSGMKNVILEKKIAALLSALENRDVQIAEVIASTNSDPKSVNMVNKKLEELLSTKNSEIQELHLQLARMCRAYDDMLKTWEERLEMLGIPREELGFTSLRPSLAKLATRQIW